MPSAQHPPRPFVRPMMATPGPAPTRSGWSWEFKWDGVRAIGYALSPGQLRLFSRNDREVTTSYPELGALTDLLGRHEAIVDGEIVALDGGRPRFGLLQHRMHVRTPPEQLVGRIPVTYYLFDLLHLDGRSLLDQPYHERRARLEDLGLDGRTVAVRVPPHYTDVDGSQLLEVADQHGLEGVVAKRTASRYEPGRRSPAWIKTALVKTQEVIICGWKAGEGRRAGTLGSLLLGAHDTAGRLVFIGHVGTGFTEPMLRDLHARLAALHRRDSPYDLPVPREHARNANWVHPSLVGEVEYRTFTGDQRLRHAAWRGLRPDRDTAEVTMPALS